jgi:uncharacterized protein YfaS (alpha-2-macroglobulin family)
MEQTSSISYPNVMVLRYLRKAGQVAPEVAMKAHEFVNLGYQRLLTFESPTGGFNWWGDKQPGNVVLTGLGIQQFEEMSKVHTVDRGIIDRSRRWLAKLQAADGSWDKETNLHGNNMQLGASKLRTTSYILYSLLSAGDQGAHVEKGIAYLKKHLAEARGDLYSLALVANALVLWNAKDPAAVKLLEELAQKRTEDPKTKAVSWAPQGETETYSRGPTAAIETTALVALAMIKADSHHSHVNGALSFLVQSKGAYGNWDSTQATIMALKALLASMGGESSNADMTVEVALDGKRIATERFTSKNSDVLRLVDPGPVGAGTHTIELRPQGKANVMYQIVARTYLPWRGGGEQVQEPLTIRLDYDKKQLRVDDIVTANARVEYHLPKATFMVIVDLGIPPGFSVLTEDLDALVKKQTIQRFSTTGRQVTLYLGEMRKEKPVQIRYRLKAKFPIRAKTPQSVAYEYYTPTSRGVQKPELIVVEKSR